MIHTVALDEVLTRLHICSRAEQTALYFMAYPGYNNLILCETTGSNPRPERYWRPHLADADTIQAIQEATQAFPLPDKSITRTQEQSIAIPIVHGDDTIGVVVHCYTGKGPKNLQALYHAVQQQSKNLFAGWVEFTIAEQSRPLSILFNIAGSISSSLDLDRVLLNVVEQATVLFRVKMSSLMLLNCKTQELEMQTAYGCSLEYLDKPNVPIHGSILGRVVLENNLIQVERIASEPAYLHKEFAKKEGVQSLLAAPISFKNTVLGVLNIYSSIPRRWQRSEMELLQTFANHAAVAITNARVHNQVVSMEEQLQVSAKLASVGELAAGLAHEIRNPLAVINMLIHSWKSSLPAPQDFADDVEVIAQKITDLNTLVSDLLSLARPRPLMKAVCNLQEMTERVLRLLHHRISLQKVQIESRF
ncbi:MAG: GAF domain-containing protein, partial [bacterium]|nr:GAF domain-containing protein [bacterium]